MADDKSRHKLPLRTLSHPETPKSEKNDQAIAGNLYNRASKPAKIKDETDANEAVSFPPEDNKSVDKKPESWKGENEAQRSFDERDALWVPSVNQYRHKEFIEACFSNLKCSLYDIFASDANVRAEPRLFREFFTPTVEELITLTNTVSCPLWAQFPLPHESFVLALQYASMLRQNDHRPWHYIYRSWGDSFVNFMAQSLRSSEATGGKPLSARELVESTHNSFCARRESPTIMGKVLHLMTTVFDDAVKVGERTMPSPIEGRLAPEVYKSCHEDWVLVNQVIWRLSYSLSK